MRLSPFAHRIRRCHNAGFTIVEAIVVTALVGIVGLIAYSALYSGMILSKQNVGINLSSLRARQMIDRIGEQARYSIEQPVLINTSGQEVSGASSDGVLVKRFIGGPYGVNETGGTTGDILTSATQFMLEFNKDLPPPEAGDWILMETVTNPELEISAATRVSGTSTTERWRITTTSAINELLRPSTYRVRGVLYRREAFTFVATETGTNPRTELRHYNRVRASTNYTTKANYRVRASGFRKNGNQPYFENGTFNGQAAITLSTVVHSSGQKEYLEEAKNTTRYTTIPIQLRLWSITR